MCETELHHMPLSTGCGSQPPGLACSLRTLEPGAKAPTHNPQRRLHSSTQSNFLCSCLLKVFFCLCAVPSHHDNGSAGPRLPRPGRTVGCACRTHHRCLQALREASCPHREPGSWQAGDMGELQPSWRWFWWPSADTPAGTTLTPTWAATIVVHAGPQHPPISPRGVRCSK